MSREQAFGSEMKQMGSLQPLAKLLNWALTNLMVEHPEIALMGEDVGHKEGFYGVTQKLIERHGLDRVIDTLLDEQSILGLAIGIAHNGFIPIPEIQFLAYLHNAKDQTRGEATTLSFFSNGQFANPMVLRIAGLGYQKEFGGHFHNDNSLANTPRHSRHRHCLPISRRRCGANDPRMRSARARRTTRRRHD